MAKSKFTPGPWFVSGQRATMDGQRWLRVLQETPEWELAFIPYGDRTYAEHIQATANARLIAAAPDFYKQAELNVGGLVLLRMAIRAGDPAKELYRRIDSLISENASLLERVGRK